jgi:Holliday junction resolvase RusA-like endonuclease
MKITVYGQPGTQGSHRKGKFGQIIHDSPTTMPWREAVKQAVMVSYPVGARGVSPILYSGSVALVIQFFMACPKRAKPGDWVAVRPDCDKLIRSTGDALTEMGVYEDDSRVVSLGATKRYCGSAPGVLVLPGAIIEVFPVTQPLQALAL